MPTKQQKSKIKMGTEYAVAQRHGPVHSSGNGPGMPAGLFPPKKMTCIDIKPNGRYVMQYESYSWADKSGLLYLSTDHGWVSDKRKTKRRRSKLIEVGKAEIIGTWDDFKAGRYERRGRGWHPKPDTSQTVLA